ncbi:hypothetical protein COV16_01390 [Candidatus Woesearchaeota archaeon CG10_big_fil_rev_8_21_14_0_10_34_8]|jgi:hypothetical protein|nr:MAG: hypothetical protein COV16_01390 [Candidatus Woesearchaeota archaeon CG10_big_fil_rev_8_21_14_0_10_34_8]
MKKEINNLLEILKTGKFTQDELSEKLGKSKTTIRRWLKELRKEGMEISKDLPNESKQIHFSYRQSLLEIVENESYVLPMTTFVEPEIIPIKDPRDYSIGIANTLFAGGKTNKTLFTNFLKYADATETDAILITGNTVWMDLTRYSKYKPDRATNSEADLDHRLINYPNIVKASKRDPKILLEENKPVYITFKERLDIVIEKNLKHLFLDDSNKPLYSGPIYITLGDMEEELVRQHTNELVRITRNQEAEAVQSKIRDLKDEAKGYFRQYKDAQKEQTKLMKQVEVGVSEYDSGNNPLDAFNIGAPLPDDDDENEEELFARASELEDDMEQYMEKREELFSEVKQWEEYKSRIIMTNTDENFIKIASSQMMGYIVNRIEEAIPNSKVISTGESYIKLNDKVGKIIPCANKLSGKPSDSLMSRLKKRVASDLHQGDPTIDFVIGGGLSPGYSREYVPSKGLKKSTTISVIQMPTCIDSKACEDKSASKVRTAGDDLAKLAQQADFKSGAIRLRYVDNILVTEKLREEWLTNTKRFSSKEKILSSRIAYAALVSDQHFMSRYSSLIKTKNNIEPTYTTSQQLMRVIKAPLVTIFSLGDELQEKNYDTEAELHPDMLTPTQLRRHIEEIEKIENPEERQNKMKKLTLEQSFRNGMLMPMDQLDEYLNNLDYQLIADTIKRADDVGLYGPAYLIINGNHNAHTTWGMFTTSKQIAREVRIRMQATSDEVIMEDQLMQRIMAPMLGQEGLYQGLWGIAPGVKHGKVLNQKESLEQALRQDGQHLYALYARHKQRSAKTGSTMKGQRDAFNDRGQAFRITEGRDYLVLSGHDHMAGETSAKRGEHVRGMCFMERNSFGEKFDFGAPTIGFHILGMPVGGYAEGPMITIDFPVEYIQKWANDGPEVNSEKLFRNSVTYDNKKE